MSKRLRVLVALATVAAMMFSLFGIASAQFSDVDEDAAYADDVELLADLGITTGVSATEFGPDQPLTRQQFAVFVIRAMKQSAVANTFANWSTNFSDDAAIAPWARGHVYLASQAKIINGYPDGTFRPNNPVSQAEALTMLVRALGFGAYAEERGGFPAGYLLVATELGLDEGLTLTDANLPMQRWEMAVALVNALNATRAKNDDGSPKDDPATSWLAALWNEDPSFVFEGTVKRIRTASDRIDVDDRTFDYDDKTIVLWNNDEIDGASVEDKTYLDVDDFVQVTYEGNLAKEINVLTFQQENDPLEGVATDEGETDFGTIEVDGVTYDVDDDTVILLNGREVSLADLEEAFDDFQDEWGSNAEALVSVRTFGTNTNDAIYVSVITNNIVEGEIERLGQDKEGPYARIDGEKVYYDEDWVGTAQEPKVGDEVVWLLGDDDVAYVALDTVTGDDTFFAIVLGYEQVDTDEYEVEVELADGSTLTVETDNVANADPGDVAWVEITGGQAEFFAPGGGTSQAGNSGVATTVRSTYIIVGGTTYPLAPGGVLVFDADGQADYDDIEEGVSDVDIFLTDEDEVGYIFIN